MSDRQRPPWPRAAPAPLLAALVLTASAATGFLLYRLTARERTTLYPETGPTVAPMMNRSLPQEPAFPLPRAMAAVIPEQLPAITLPGADGTAHALAEWKGRPLLINFWATWCEPCRREIPLLRTLRQERSADGLEVVGIAVDVAEAVRTYIPSHGIDYPVLVGEQGGLAAANAFGMEAVLPFSVFADHTGRVITLKVGELHRNEAELILDRVREVDGGRLSPAAARGQISTGLQRLHAQIGRADRITP